MAESAIFYFGSHAVNREDLEKAVNTHVNHYEALRSGLGSHLTQAMIARPQRAQKASLVYKNSAVQGSGLILLETMCRTSDLIAEETRDKVYAVCAPARVESVESLRPDYDISLRELWLRTAKSILSTPADLQILDEHSCKDP